MAANVGTVDRVLRFIIGAALIVMPLINFMGLGASMIVATLLIAVGVVLVVTGLIGTCPIYSVLGIKTKS